MDPFTWLYAITAILLIAAYLLTPYASNTDKPTSLADFDYPDNSSSKPVPIIYGTAYIKGNCMYFGNLTHTNIYTKTGSK